MMNLSTLQSKSSLPSHNIPTYAVPKGKTLYPFQKKAIKQTLKFLRANETNSVYNACEQGLGKTIQTICVLNCLKAERVLIVCPAIMRYVWKEELYNWATFPCDPYIFTTSKNLPSFLSSKRNFICSYDLVRTPAVLKLLSNCTFDAIIFDEAHALNNTTAKCTKACLKTLFPKSKYHIFLSGTPFTTSVINGYSIFHKVAPSYFPDFPKFVDNYSYSRPTPWGNEYFGVKNAKILRKIIRSNFYLRYTKKEVLTDLPDKTFQKISLPFTYAVEPKAKNDKEQLEIELHMLRKYLEAGKSPPPIPSTLAEHRRLQGEAKVKPVADFVLDQLINNIPVVLFAHHRSVINELTIALRDFSPVVITGKTKPKERQAGITAFQNGETNLFIGNFVAAGTGITLTRSSTVVLAELDWSPSIISQAVDRCHRIGQKDAVIIYYFVVNNSLDETISNIIINRTKVFNQVLE